MKGPDGIKARAQCFEFLIRRLRRGTLHLVDHLEELPGAFFRDAGLSLELRPELAVAQPDREVFPWSIKGAQTRRWPWQSAPHLRQAKTRRGCPRLAGGNSRNLPRCWRLVAGSRGRSVNHFMGLE